VRLSDKLESAVLVACGIGGIALGLYSIFFSSQHPLWGFFLLYAGIYLVVAAVDWSIRKARRDELGKRERALWSSILRVYRSPIGWVVSIALLVILILYLWRGELAAGGESEIGLWSFVCPVLYIVAMLILAALMFRHWQDRHRRWF
jgi:MFS family permease